MFLKLGYLGLQSLLVCYGGCFECCQVLGFGRDSALEVGNLLVRVGQILSGGLLGLLKRRDLTISLLLFGGNALDLLLKSGNIRLQDSFFGGESRDILRRCLGLGCELLDTLSRFLVGGVSGGEVNFEL